MGNKIKEILDGIYLSLNNKNTGSLSLFGGDAGAILYKIKYLKYKNMSVSDELSNEIQLLAENAIDVNYHPFCGGKSGINWFFNYLYKENYLDKESLELQNEDNMILADSSLSMIKTGNYDFLHGAVGIAYQLLYADFNANDYFQKMLIGINELCNTSWDKQMPPFFDFKNNLSKVNEVNMGLAHGIPSILKFSLECYRKNICQSDAIALTERIVNYLLRNINDDVELNYFPSTVSETSKTNSHSRLAWCYGDLGVAYILYQAGLILQNNEVANLSLEILRRSTSRRNAAQTNVNDGAFCHGSAGISYIYQKLWNNTREVIFKDASEFWLKETLRYAIFNGGKVTYNRYDPIEKINKESYSLLEGSVGVGLVLVSSLIHDYSWDYCLMLNN